MNDELFQMSLSAFSLIAAVSSAVFTFYIYRTSRLDLQKYDLEIDHLKKQMQYNAFFEIRKALDDLNNKMVDWDVDLPILGGKVKFDRLEDRKKAIIFLNRINILFYSLLQKDSIGDKYLQFLKRWTESSIYNAAQRDDVTKKMIDIILKSEPSEPAEMELVNILKGIEIRLSKDDARLN